MNNKKKITIANFFYILLILIIITFGIWKIGFKQYINLKSIQDVDDVIYIGNYGYLPEKEKYIKLVTDRWKEMGHNSKLVFEDWDCYEELPDEKYDVFIYDGVVYKSLRDKDILEKIDNIDTSYTFNWTNDLLEKENNVYAVPFLLCSDFLIYNNDKVDLSKVNSLEDVNTTFTTQYKSMVLSYYLTSLLSLEEENVALDIEKGEYKEEVLEKLYKLIDKMNIEDYQNSSSSTYIGKEQMNDEIYNSLYGFSESIYNLKDIIDKIEIENISLMENQKNKAYYVDMVSIKNGVSAREEKLYTELIELMTDEDINYKYLYNKGDYLYLLSANRNVLNQLSSENRIYNKLYNFVSLNTNRVFLYGPSYYDEFSLIKDDLKAISDRYISLKSEN